MKTRNHLLATMLCAAFPLAHAEGPMEMTIVTGTRFAAAPESSPVNVTVITASDIKKSTARTLPALLAQHAGIQVRSTDGTPDMAIDLRGFGMTGNQNTLVLLDGQQLNDIELTSIDWSAIPLDSVERIEIVNGSGAVLYGGGATGGTINIITKKHGKGTKAAVSAGLGSYNSKDWRVSMEASGERTGMHISASTLNSDNYRTNNNIAQSNLEGDVRTEAGHGDAVLKFGMDSQNLRLPGARKVNPGIGQNQLATDRRGATTPLDYANRQGAHVSLGTSQQLDFGTLAAELAYREKKAQAYYDNGGFPSYLDTNLKLLSFTPRMKIEHQLGGVANELTVGTDFADWNYDSVRAAGPASVGTPAAHILAKQSNRALYAQNTTSLSSSTRLTLGARTQQTDYQARDIVNPATYASANQSRSVSVYEAGLRHDLNPALSLFGRVGRSFRMATVDEIYAQYGGPGFTSIVTMLEPQKSLDREIGLDYKSDATSARASMYYMDLTNEIHYNPITFANMNLTPTRRYGVELEGTHAYADGFGVRAAYSYTVAKFRDGNFGGTSVSGNDIPLVPRQRLVLGASWDISERTTLNGDATYVGDQHFDNDQTNTFGQKMPSYTTVDVKLSHKAGPWSLAAAVNNLFNEKYFTYAVASTAGAGVYNAYPMPERNFLLNAKYAF